MSAPLPTFVGIGAAKAGTTSIYRYLDEHPDVHMSRMKETNYFAFQGQRDRRFRIRSRAAYERQFAGASGARAIGEFSPQYMNYPGVAERLAEALPQVRLLASLRAPAERAYSCWVGSMCNGLERRPAEEALVPGTRYIERGFYSERLRPFLERFPPDRIRIVLFEELARDPAGVMAGIYEFIGVDPSFRPDLSVRHNAGALPRHPRLNRAWWALRRLQPRNFQAPARLVRWHRALLERTYAPPPPLDPALRARLLDLYRDEVGRMEELLGRDLPEWRR